MTFENDDVVFDIRTGLPVDRSGNVIDLSAYRKPVAVPHDAEVAKLTIRSPRTRGLTLDEIVDSAAREELAALATRFESGSDDI